MNMTAKEFLRNKKNEIGLRSQSSPLGSEGIEIETMIDFAKYHVEQALNEVFENAKVELSKDWIRKEETIHPNSLVSSINVKVNKDSILNAYPLENIK